MTMYTLPNFCRVCLKYDKNLIDLEHIENEPNETLMSKLQQCVSEVEWKIFKPLLCHPCIKRLNIAYTFKKQCVQSATMLKSYVALVSKSKTEGEEAKSDATSSNTYMMLPNQKYIKIVVGGPQSQNNYQNVFLNVLPTPSLQPISTDKGKDSNQNVFLSISNTIQKFVPPPTDSSNVNDMLTHSKSEELSVEIDPLDLGVGDETASEDEEQNNGVNDWEDVISAMKISPKSNGKSFVPILPKQEEKMDFSNSGEHFLSSQLYDLEEFSCEACQKTFTSKINLRHHLKNFHMGKLPFKCEFCGIEFMTRAQYEACTKFHKGAADSLETTLTLNDFKKDPLAPSENENEVSDPTDVVCNICHRTFNSPSGMLRHKVRKHNQKTKKKYFIKGMKNAKCDICNREFSTQSYMQLHRKLHMRDDIGYKYKVFGKNRYMKSEEEKKNEDKGAEEKADNQEEGKREENIEAKEDEESNSNSDNGSEN